MNKELFIVMGLVTDANNESVYYWIGVEAADREGDIRIADYVVPIDKVSEDKLYGLSRDIFSFDEKTGIVTYDLGKSVFKVKLEKKKGSWIR